MAFWAIISAMAVAVAVLLTARGLRQRRQGQSAAEFDLAVYRDQLREVERDLARGILTDEMAERTRVEISRRILDADRAREAPAEASAPRWSGAAMAVLAGVLVVGGSLAGYAWLGAPGYGDLPLAERLAMAESFRENRPRQAAAEAQVSPPPAPPPPAEYAALMDQLRATVAERPGDTRGLRLLAQNEATLGNYTAAHVAQAQLVQLLGEDATGGDYAALAEFYILAAGGYVSPEAEEALIAALDRDPENGPARYSAGLLFVQTGRPDLAFGYWRPLLETSSYDAPWVPAIRAQIVDVAARAGVRYTLPPLQEAAPGPSADDMAAAADMTPEERRAMVQSMVDGLATRLANDGGTGAEWARLISALGVLGQTERAQAIYNEALNVFAADPGAIEAVQAAAIRAGLEL